MKWFVRIWSYFFPPLLSAQYDLEERCGLIGTLLLQQVQGPEKLYWMAQLRAYPCESNTGHRYAWTAEGDHVYEAIQSVLDKTKDWKIGARPLLEDRPKLGGAQFDAETNVRRLEPPSWD